MKRLGQTIRELWRDPMGRIGMLGILIVILMAVFAPHLSHFGPEKMVGLPKSPPDGEFWFGTDNYGRDIFSRILYGARVSLQVGIIAVGIAATAGYVLGLVAGYFEGWVDRVIMCVMDIFFAFPSILLAIFISAVLGRGLVNTMIAIGIVNIPVFARTVRASVISAKGWSTSRTPNRWASGPAPSSSGTSPPMWWRPSPCRPRWPSLAPSSPRPP